jgi:branched-chain amino acid transport system permease protein
MKKWIAILLTFAIVQVLIYLNVVNDYLQATIATICINIILAVSLNLVTGFTGQFSLGHAGFMSIGAYVCGIILMRVPTVWGFLIGLFAGAIIAAIAFCPPLVMKIPFIFTPSIFVFGALFLGFFLELLQWLNNL